MATVEILDKYTIAYIAQLCGPYFAQNMRSTCRLFRAAIAPIMFDPYHYATMCARNDDIVSFRAIYHRYRLFWKNRSVNMDLFSYACAAPTHNCAEFMARSIIGVRTRISSDMEYRIFKDLIAGLLTTYDIWQLNSINAPFLTQLLLNEGHIIRNESNSAAIQAQKIGMIADINSIEQLYRVSRNSDNILNTISNVICGLNRRAHHEGFAREFARVFSYAIIENEVTIKSCSATFVIKNRIATSSYYREQLSHLFGYTIEPRHIPMFDAEPSKRIFWINIARGFIAPKYDTQAAAIVRDYLANSPRHPRSGKPFVSRGIISAFLRAIYRAKIAKNAQEFRAYHNDLYVQPRHYNRHYIARRMCNIITHAYTVFGRVRDLRVIGL